MKVNVDNSSGWEVIVDDVPYEAWEISPRVRLT